MDEIEKITPIKITKGLAISLGKRKTNFLKINGGINEDLLGPIQPDSSKREDLQKCSCCGEKIYCRNCNHESTSCKTCIKSKMRYSEQ